MWRFLTLCCSPAAFPAQVPATESLEHEIQAMRACTGHVLQEQTHTGLLHSEVASIPAGPLEKNTRAMGMVFAVNTVVLQCRCEGGGRVARVLVCVCMHACVHARVCVCVFWDTNNSFPSHSLRFNALPITLRLIFKNFICIASFTQEMLFKVEHSLYYILHSTGQHIQWFVVVQ